MENNNYFLNIEQKNPEKYFSDFDEFCKQNDIKRIDHEPLHDEIFYQEKINGVDEFRMVRCMEKNGIRIAPPKNVAITNGTTLFFSAGIQHLDDVIHKETEIPEKSFFVSQPVLRSQYLNSSKPASFTSFYNVCTLSCDVSFLEHLTLLKTWIEFLVEEGFDKDKIEALIISTNPKIGNRSYVNYPIKIYYAGLEVGDAVYIPSMPQDTRQNFSVSDIGFGLERLNYSTFKKDEINSSLNDYLRTISLLALSGVEPGNKNHGYRFRMFSKKIVENLGLNFQLLLKSIQNLEGYFELWASVKDNPPEEAYRMILLECERNFNRLLLDYLISNYGLNVQIDINQPTNNFFTQLELTGVKDKDFWLLVRKQIYL